MGDETTAVTTLSLDERKFLSETELKRVEIALREREVSVKEIELRRSRLLNPTFIGLVAATLGLGANIFVAFVGNRNAQRIEHSRLQSSLIVQAVGTGNAGAACKNLVSFVRLGLLDDTNGNLSKCLTDPQVIPVLPAAQNYNVSSDFIGSNAVHAVATRIVAKDNYKFTVNLIVPRDKINNGRANLITVYAYQLDNSGNRSNYLTLPSVNGDWRAGDRVTFTTELPTSYLADTSKKSHLEYCVGTSAGCTPGGDLLVPR